MAVSAGRAEILLWPLFADMVIKSMIQIRTYEDRVTPRVLHPYHKFSRVCRPSVCSNRKTIDACLVLWLMYVGRSSAVDALMLHAYAARVCWFGDGCTRHGAPLPPLVAPVLRRMRRRQRPNLRPTTRTSRRYIAASRCPGMQKCHPRPTKSLQRHSNF
jgi:hypothetical protein